MKRKSPWRSVLLGTYMCASSLSASVPHAFEEEEYFTSLTPCFKEKFIKSYDVLVERGARDEDLPRSLACVIASLGDHNLEDLCEPQTRHRRVKCLQRVFACTFGVVEEAADVFTQYMGQKDLNEALVACLKHKVISWPEDISVECLDTASLKQLVNAMYSVGDIAPLWDNSVALRVVRHLYGARVLDLTCAYFFMEGVCEKERSAMADLLSKLSPLFVLRSLSIEYKTGEKLALLEGVYTLCEEGRPGQALALLDLFKVLQVNEPSMDFMQIAHVFWHAARHHHPFYLGQLTHYTFPAQCWALLLVCPELSQEAIQKLQRLGTQEIIFTLTRHLVTARSGDDGRGDFMDK